MVLHRLAGIKQLLWDGETGGERAGSGSKPQPTGVVAATEQVPTVPTVQGGSQNGPAAFSQPLLLEADMR